MDNREKEQKNNLAEKFKKSFPKNNRRPVNKHNNQFNNFLFSSWASGNLGGGITLHKPHEEGLLKKYMSITSIPRLLRKSSQNPIKNYIPRNTKKSSTKVLINDIDSQVVRGYTRSKLAEDRFHALGKPKELRSPRIMLGVRELNNTFEGRRNGSLGCLLPVSNKTESILIHKTDSEKRREAIELAEGMINEIKEINVPTEEEYYEEAMEVFRKSMKLLVEKIERDCKESGVVLRAIWEEYQKLFSSRLKSLEEQIQSHSDGMNLKLVQQFEEKIKKCDDDTRKIKEDFDRLNIECIELKKTLNIREKESQLLRTENDHLLSINIDLEGKVEDLTRVNKSIQIIFEQRSAECSNLSTEEIRKELMKLHLRKKARAKAIEAHQLRATADIKGIITEPRSPAYLNKGVLKNNQLLVFSQINQEKMGEIEEISLKGCFC